MKKSRAVFLGILMILMIAISVGALIFIKKQKEKAEEVHNQQQEQVQGESAEENQESSDESVPELETEGQDEEMEWVEPENTIIFDESEASPAWTTGGVNLREEPNTECEVLVVLDGGVEVKKHSDKDGWAYVKYEEYVGYISMDYLTEQDPAEVPEEPNEESSTEKVEVSPGQFCDPNHIVVVIDPGHQAQGDSTKEPNGPDSTVMKARVTGGATGVATGVKEFDLNLDISLLLKEELENRGYTVYMTRNNHDVNVSNMERAQYASTVGADIAVRIHGNSVDNQDVSGAEVLVPSLENPYISHLAKASQILGEEIVNAYCEATGFRNRGVFVNDTMTGINWSEVPVTILELGFMSNPSEDQAMQDEAMQNNMVQGIANGIDAYFGL